MNEDIERLTDETVPILNSLTSIGAHPDNGIDELKPDLRELEKLANEGNLENLERYKNEKANLLDNTLAESIEAGKSEMLDPDDIIRKAMESDNPEMMDATMSATLAIKTLASLGEHSSDEFGNADFRKLGELVEKGDLSEIQKYSTEKEGARDAVLIERGMATKEGLANTSYEDELDAAQKSDKLESVSESARKYELEPSEENRKELANQSKKMEEDGIDKSDVEKFRKEGVRHGKLEREISTSQEKGKITRNLKKTLKEAPLKLYSEVLDKNQSPSSLRVKINAGIIEKQVAAEQNKAANQEKKTGARASI